MHWPDIQGSNVFEPKGEQHVENVPLVQRGQEKRET